MANKKTFKKLATFSLFVIGVFVFLLGIVVFALGLALNHNDTFNDNRDLKSKVRPRIDYVQYWVGLPFVMTGLSIIINSFNLRKIQLTICTLILSMVCVVLALAGLVVDGPDFSYWKDMRAERDYWEDQSGYACSTVGDKCMCKGSSATDLFTKCETLTDISTVYGILIGSMIIVLVILLAAIFIIVYVITTKREKANRSKRYKTTKVITVSSNDPDYPPTTSNPVYEAGPNTNRGYEPEPLGYDNGRPRQTREHYKGNDDTLRIQEKEGVVIMDPGRFKLGDDDIY